MSTSSALSRLNEDSMRTPRRHRSTVCEIITISDSFLKNAHSMVRKTNCKNGLLVYHKLIKSSIKCLLVVLTQLSRELHPLLEVIVCYKLARVLFYETESSEDAELYCKKALQIASRHDLGDLVVMSELLLANIMYKLHHEPALKFMYQCCANYCDEPTKSSLFSLVKDSLNGLSKTSIRALESADGEINQYHIHSMLLYIKSVLIGNPEKALAMLEKVDTLINNKDDISTEVRGFCVLNKLLCTLMIGNQGQITNVLVDLNSFYKEQHKDKWKEWSPDGTLVITGSIPFSCSFKWLTSQEFCVYFFLLSGIAVALTDKNPSKSRRVFKHCLEYVRTELSSFTSSDACPILLHDYHDRVSNFSMLKLLSKFYFEWLSLLNNKECLGESFTRHIRDLPTKPFTFREVKFNKQLLEAVRYLLALKLQSQGNYKEAFTLYLRILQLSVNPYRNETAIQSLLQLVFGLSTLGSDDIARKVHKQVKDSVREQITNSYVQNNKELGLYFQIAMALFFNSQIHSDGLSLENASTSHGSWIILLFNYLNSSSSEETEQCRKALIARKSEAPDSPQDLVMKCIVLRIELEHLRVYGKDYEIESAEISLRKVSDKLRQSLPL